MRVGILTGGGDAPGTNAVIRAIVRKVIKEYSDEFIGIRDGWRGLLENDFIELSLSKISGILPLGGSILGFSRTNPFKRRKGADLILKNSKNTKNKLKTNSNQIAESLFVLFLWISFHLLFQWELA